MKFLLFLLFFPFLTEAQITDEIILPDDAEVVWENQDLHKFFDRQFKLIEKVDGNAWVCVHEKTHFKKVDRLIMIEGVPIAYKHTGNDITISATKTDMVQYNFTTQKKTKLKKAGHSTIFRYPKNVKKKIKDKLKNGN